jgi:glycosyltransferase involved in cell wall biosynthesis
MQGINLIVVTPLKGVLRQNNRILLTQKFLEGMALYKELWGGPLTLVCRRAEQASDNLDNVEVEMGSAPFRTVCTDALDQSVQEVADSRSLVLASVNFTNLSAICRAKGIPCVYISEYTLLTRVQIAREIQRTPLHGWWHALREFRLERAQKKAITISSGIQCNGTPTYQAYQALTPQPLLYFDTRISEDLMAPAPLLEERFARLRRDKKLHLVFSGRLKRMKGVHHLPQVAVHLRKLDIPFEMSVCGDGELGSQLRSEIEGLGLQDSFKLMGNLDFKSELIPFVTKHADLFVCCHVQGDPSCTYLETMACGVPIVGYSNEAFEGLVQAAGAGWATPLHRPTDLAEQIASLHRDPEKIRAASERSLAFAREHTFEKTFRRRIDHLNQVATKFW